MNNEYKKWLTQFRKGYFELCVLLALKQKMHGAALIAYFKQQGIVINEGTLYPLLNRMQQNNWLTSSWNMPKTSGHPQKQYQISEKGKQVLPDMAQTYKEYHQLFLKLQEL